MTWAYNMWSALAGLAYEMHVLEDIVANDGVWKSWLSQ